MQKPQQKTIWESSDWTLSKHKKQVLSMQISSTNRFLKLRTEPQQRISQFDKQPRQSFSNFHQYVQEIGKKYEMPNLVSMKKRTSQVKSLGNLCSTKSLAKYESLTNLPMIY